VSGCSAGFKIKIIKKPCLAIFLFLPLFKKVVQNIFGTIFSIFITLHLFKNVVAKHLAPPFPKVD